MKEGRCCVVVCFFRVLRVSAGGCCVFLQEMVCIQVCNVQPCCVDKVCLVLDLGFCCWYIGGSVLLVIVSVVLSLLCVFKLFSVLQA